MKNTDVTKQIRFYPPDDENLPIVKCMCGNKFREWDFVISIYNENPSECPKCGRKFFFKQEITIYQVEETIE